MKKIIKPETSRVFEIEELQILIKELFEYLLKAEENIYVKKFLIIEKKLLSSDIEILKQNHEFFKIAYKNAMEIELAKLSEYAAADRLNASFVKEILNREHNSNSY